MSVMLRFECGSEDRESKEYGPYEYVQVTYEFLRIGPDGDHIAWFDAKESEWIPLAENPDVVKTERIEGSAWVSHELRRDIERVWYSDFVIFAAKEAA